MKIERQRSRICLRWTEEENDLLRTLYPSYDALLARMPHRSLAALKHRVRVMGIVVRRHVWTNREVRRLFEAYENRATNVELQRLFPRSEEHTSELQSLMRISYAVFCLKKKNQQLKHTLIIITHNLTPSHQSNISTQ